MDKSVFPDITVVLDSRKSEYSGNVNFTVRFIDGPADEVRRAVKLKTWTFDMRPGFEDDRVRPAAEAVSKADSEAEAIVLASAQGVPPDFVFRSLSEDTLEIEDPATGKILFPRRNRNVERRIIKAQGERK